ncbi:MAG TPA: homoserine dehydrogenase [Rhodanobacteraceae bacterium]|nr:homoserine dehydrogenase [Rhodanobacteraceae bacterium]
MNTRVSDVPPASLVPSRMTAPLPPRRLDVAVIGPGRVGRVLLEQLRASQSRLLHEQHLDLRLRVVIDSRHMWLDSDDEQLNARDGAQTWRPAALAELATYLATSPHALVVDCSASEAVVAHYADWLAAGIHVVTPNKLAASGALDRWRHVRAAALHGDACWHYETTVGAGLPVVKTLRELVDTGDDLVAVEGMFSGTLAWLFHHYDGGKPFSALLREAVALGYAEPDPRHDLDGLDVARKLVILAREAGLTLSLEDVDVDSLVPPALRQVDRETFMCELEQLDAPMARQHARAASRQGVLRHVGRLDADGRASVRLEVVPRTHVLANARLTDNMIVFRTRRYNENPLVVQGPGAGPEVTAAGVFADILRVAARALPA